MFASSQDILNWVLIICALSLTVFICWVAYYLIVATHKVYGIIHKIERVVNKTEEIITVINKKAKSKVYVTLFTELIKQAGGLVKKGKKDEDQSKKK